MKIKVTRIFKSGNSLAVRIPKEFNLSCTEVQIFKRNNEIIIREKPKNLAKAFKLLTQLPSDLFSEGRGDSPPQEREIL